jgi:hypothetical protein
MKTSEANLNTIPIWNGGGSFPRNPADVVAQSGAVRTNLFCTACIVPGGCLIASYKDKLTVFNKYSHMCQIALRLTFRTQT